MQIVRSFGEMINQSVIIPKWIWSTLNTREEEEIYKEETSKNIDKGIIQGVIRRWQRRQEGMSAEKRFRGWFGECGTITRVKPCALSHPHHINRTCHNGWMQHGNQICPVQVLHWSCNICICHRMLYTQGNTQCRTNDFGEWLSGQNSGSRAWVLNLRWFMSVGDPWRIWGSSGGEFMQREAAPEELGQQ